MGSSAEAIGPFLNPRSVAGAAVLAAVVFALATLVVISIRVGARRLGRHLSDETRPSITCCRFLARKRRRTTPARSPMSALHFRLDIDASSLAPRSPGNAVALSSYAVDTRSFSRQKVNAKLLILVGRVGIEPTTKGL